MRCERCDAEVKLVCFRAVWVCLDCVGKIVKEWAIKLRDDVREAA